MTILGAVVITRNGDRTQFYQDPHTFQSGKAILSPLGEVQALQLGSYLRSEYLNPSSPNFIAGISTDLVNHPQVQVRGDNGAEGNVIMDSAQAMLQGLYPPTSSSKIHLANGTTVTGPFGGYQYLPVMSVEPDQGIELEGWSDCPAFNKHIQDFYNSQAFKDRAQAAAPFLNDVRPYLYGMDNKFENMWNIFDFIHVNMVHNETYAFRLPPTFQAQAQAHANFHQYGIFTDSSPEGIGNIAGRTMLPLLIDSLEKIAEERNPIKLAIESVSYKPMISLFNLTNVAEFHPELAALPNYASAIALELRKDDDGEVFLRTKFKNGTADAAFKPIHLFGHKGDMALNEFLYRLDLAAIHDTAQWCKVCGQSVTRGCAACAPNDIKAADIHDSISDSIRTLPIERGHKTISIAEATAGPTPHCTPLLGALNAQFPLFSLLVFMFIAFAGMFKFFRSRRGRAPQLPGNEEALPARVRYYDIPNNVQDNKTHY